MHKTANIINTHTYLLGYHFLRDTTFTGIVRYAYAWVISSYVFRTALLSGFNPPLSGSGRHTEKIVEIKKGWEVDFVVKSCVDLGELIRVCWNLGDGVKEREVRGLVATMWYFNIRKATIITEDTLKE